MTIEELKAAYAAGAKIQIYLKSQESGSKREGWFDLNDPKFNGLNADDYRIKPYTEEEMMNTPYTGRDTI